MIDAKVSAMKELAQADVTFSPHDEENPHNHPSDFGTEVRYKHVRAAKDIADSNPFETAGRVVDRVLATLPSGLPKSYYIRPKNVVRVINRTRADRFPKVDTKSWNYEVKLDVVPSKAIKNISVCHALLL